MHFIRKEILKKLMFKTKLRFSELQIEEITSKHFNYHLKELIKEGLIVKDVQYYILTNKGKDFIGKLDERGMKLEKQPKVSVAIIVTREGKNGKELLLSKRLKQPYYGKVGGFTGKVRFGESFKQAARRELKEEAGLTGKFRLAGVKRKFGFSEGECIQDQVMVFFHVTDTKGDLIEKTQESENFWQEYKDMKKRTDMYSTASGFIDFTLDSKMEGFEIRDEAKGY